MWAASTWISSSPIAPVGLVGRRLAAVVAVVAAGGQEPDEHGRARAPDQRRTPLVMAGPPFASASETGILQRMPRAIWSGAISFGLVNIPIKLYAAVSRKTVSFNQLDCRTGARIKYKKVSAADGEEVPAEAIIKGYELSSGAYVTVGDDELASLDPEASRTIDIEEFVDLVDIDPLFYDSAYYVAPDKATTKPYALLTQAMEESGKVGVARFVMRSKQYLCAIRPKDGALVLSTMVYADEVNEPAEIAEIADLEDVDAHQEGAGHGAPAHRVAVGTTSTPTASRTPTATRCSTSSSARPPATPRSWRRPR